MSVFVRPGVKMSVTQILMYKVNYLATYFLLLVALITPVLLSNNTEFTILGLTYRIQLPNIPLKVTLNNARSFSEAESIGSAEQSSIANNYNTSNSSSVDVFNISRQSPCAENSAIQPLPYILDNSNRTDLLTSIDLTNLLTQPSNVNSHSNPEMESNAVNMNNSKSLSHRNEKFIFTIVKIENSLCGSGDQSGTCLTSSQCQGYGGTVIASCGKGYGVCCKVTSSTCGGDIRVNNTWVMNVEYPDYFNEVRTCTWKVYFDDTPGKICQIRYDFAANTLTGPSDTGMCLNDQLIFVDDPKSTYFCGVAPANYHWYVDTAGTTSPHTFTIKTDGSNFNRRYAMMVSYIPCKIGVPTSCGQYFTGLNGTFVSYNYNVNSYYLAGLSYSICFRKEKGYCTYTLQKTSNNQYIDSNDVLRLPMGISIPTPANPAILGSATACRASSSVKFSQMYYTAPQCFYPDSMTSVQLVAPFLVTVTTALDSFTNYNPRITSPIISGFQFNWASNLCP